MNWLFEIHKLMRRSYDQTVPVPSSDPATPFWQMAMQNDDAIPIITWVVAQKTIKAH
jgi:hypothetical protein